MSDWFDLLIWRVAIPFTLAMSLVMLIETLPLRLAAVHRSWLWRGVYLKTILIAFLPSATMITIAIPEFFPKNAITTVAVSPATAEVALAVADTSHVTDDLHDRTVSTTAIEVPISSQPSKASVGGRFGWPSGSGVQWWLFAIWMSGVWLLGLMFVFRYVQIWATIYSGSTPASLEIMNMVVSTSRQLGVRRPGAVLLSPGVTGPMLMLAGRTTLVLPTDFESRYGAESCRMAIAHELAHHRRGDLWWNLITAVVSIALFFWPPAWIAARRYYLAMEMACDNEAIRRARLSLVEYAELLVRLLDDNRDRSFGVVSLSMAWAGSFRALSERIRFMKVDVQNFRVRQNLSFALAIVVLGLMSIPVSFGQEEEKKSKSTGSVKLDNSAKDYQEKKEEPKPNSGASASASSASGGFSFGASGGQGGTYFGRNGSSGGGVVFGSGSASASVGGEPMPKSTGSSPSSSTSSSNRSTGSGGKSMSSASGTARSSNGVSVTQSVEEVDGVEVKTTRIQNKKSEVTIVEDDTTGITVTIIEKVKGKEDQLRVFQADDAEQLRKDSAEAYRWYKKYATGENGMVSVQNGGAAGGMAFGQAGGGAGGGPGNVPFGAGGAAGQGANPARAMMEQQLRQMMEETEDPILKEQIKNMLERMKGLEK
jgi:beta-lactamase regulating signal transducer with metallopeptidase domain